MQADHKDRHGAADTQSRHSTQTLITAIAVVILAAGAYLLAPSDNEESDSADREATPDAPTELMPTEPTPAAPILAAPDIPDDVDEEPDSAVDPEPAVEPLPTPPPPPTPEELDSLLRDAVAETELTAGPGLEAALGSPYLMDRAVSSVDQLARGLVPRRTLNIARPSGKFPVLGMGDTRRMDPAGYARYDGLVESIVALDTADLAGLFHKLRPQLQSAYGALGYPADKADNALIAALDAIINAPVRNEAPTLVSKGALWAYADPSLENASDIHQQLLRTGPDNTEKLQAWAAEFRKALLQGP